MPHSQSGANQGFAARQSGPGVCTLNCQAAPGSGHVPSRPGSSGRNKAFWGLLELPGQREVGCGSSLCFCVYEFSETTHGAVVRGLSRPTSPPCPLLNLTRTCRRHGLWCLCPRTVQDWKGREAPPPAPSFPVRSPRVSTCLSSGFPRAFPWQLQGPRGPGGS